MSANQADGLDLDLLAASLRADGADVGSFVEALAAKLEEALPGAVQVQRSRKGVRGPKRVTRITVTFGDERLELRREPGRDAANAQFLRARVSGGIVIRTERLEFDAWLDALVAGVAVEARRSDQTRQALTRLLLDDG